MHNEETQKTKDTNVKKPNEEGTIHISEFLKISDPESGKVLLNKRES